MLSEYTLVHSQTFAELAPYSDFSGGCYDGEKLWMVGNSSANLYGFSVNEDGRVTLSQTIQLDSEFSDLEGMTYLGNGEYALVEEDATTDTNSLIYIFTITVATTSLSKSDCSVVNTSISGETSEAPYGVEAVAYDKERSVFYVSDQKSSGGTSAAPVYSVDRNGNSTLLFDTASKLNAYGVVEIAGLHYSNNSLWIVHITGEPYSYRITKCDLNGNYQDQRTLGWLPPYNIEGIVLSPQERFMWVIGEGNGGVGELYYYVNSNIEENIGDMTKVYTIKTTDIENTDRSKIIVEESEDITTTVKEEYTLDKIDNTLSVINAQLSSLTEQKTALTTLRDTINTKVETVKPA